MIIIDNNSALLQLAEELRDKKVAFVPTMGNLHAGHLSLVDVAKAHAQVVIVSIFVNPIQFGENEDFDQYPRTLGADSYALCNKNVDYLYTPAQHDLFPSTTDAVKVSLPGLASILCGEFRPGHFDGVSTILLKLFNLVKPDIVVMGEKDYQQLILVRAMIKELFLPVQLVSAPTVREKDGLAMSSRNRYLNAAERVVAPELYRVLLHVREQVNEGEVSYRRLEERAMYELSESGFRPEYVSLRNSHTLAVADKHEKDLVVLAAAWLGETRLIDNVIFTKGH